MKLFLFYTVSLSYHGTEEGTVVIVAAPNSPTQEGGGSVGGRAWTGRSVKGRDTRYWDTRPQVGEWSMGLSGEEAIVELSQLLWSSEIASLFPST